MFILIPVLNYLLFLIPMTSGASVSNLNSLTSDTAITIIIKQSPADLEIGYNNKFNEYQLTYFGRKSDTISIPKLNWVTIRIKYLGKTIIYGARKGDSLIITTTPKLQFKCINETKKQYDTLFFSFMGKRLEPEYLNFKKLELLTYKTPPPKDSSKPWITIIKKVEDKTFYERYAGLAKKINTQEWSIIDSLKAIGKLSNEFALTYGSIIDANYIRRIIECYKQTKKDDYLKILKNRYVFNAVYLKYDAGSYKEMLEGYMQNVIAKSNFFKYSRTAITFDYKMIFDSAKNYTSGKILDYIRFTCLKYFKEEQPDSIYHVYFNKFVKLTKDTDYINYFTSPYPYPIESSKRGKNNLLYSNDNSNNRFISDILIENKGHILYIDLWASWCSPCIALIPDMEKLRDEYSGKNIKFLYLSVDENYTRWKTAAATHNLSNYSLSYLFAQPRNSTFLKGLQVNEIPRYLIIDKTGKIIKTHAPQPCTKEVRALLNQELSK